MLHQLLFDPDLVPGDVERLLRQRTSTLHQKLQPHRLRDLQDNPRIKAWLSLDSPSLLLVNGNAASDLDLSTAFFSSKITNTLMHHVSQPRGNIEIIPLAYFCGQHPDYEGDVVASPTALAKSLLAQLVKTHKDFEARDLQECLEHTATGEISAIIGSLARLLGRLPLEAVVFVIVDGVEHFSRPKERKNEFCEVVSHLLRLFIEQRGAKVKLLFTSAQKAAGLHGLGSIMNDEISH